ncbi:hypothetical protein ColTof3_08383 [Colletotrichum tofieldiae]|nr:hypothetical protein ColTof3_08383 [Colletotrichum tofieldiae]
MPKDKEPEVVVDGTLSSPNDAEARLTPPHPGGNITARVFLSHVFNATSQLCDAVPDWLVLSRSAPPEDREASTTLALSWFSSFELITFYLGETIKAMPSPSQSAIDTATTALARCFYNQTSYTFVRKAHTHLFSTRIQERPPFAAFLYDDAGQVAEVSNTLLAVITSGSLLLRILSKGNIVLQSRQIQNGTRDARSWTSAQLAFALIAPAYDEAAPLFHTAVSATRVVSVTQAKLRGLIDASEELGNRTGALCSGPTPVTCGEDDGEWFMASRVFIAALLMPFGKP